MDVIVTSEQLLDPDYAFRPIPMDPMTKLLIGVMAVTFVVAAVLALVLTDDDWRFVRRWWTVVGSDAGCWLLAPSAASPRMMGYACR